MRPLPSLCLLALISLTAGAVRAENGRYFPIDHRMAPGQAALLMMRAHPELCGCLQPVRVVLPQQGQVTFYDGGTRRPVAAEAPAQASLSVGYVFRFKLSGMTDYPDVELYPTVELLDRLHPPSGKAEEFPIPIPITEDEIDAALKDRMVTKVIYLEQPDFASSEPDLAQRVTEFPAAVNLLEAADRLGRPMAILRIGGRLPDPQNANDFYGPGVVRLSPRSVKPERPGFVRLSN